MHAFTRLGLAAGTALAASAAFTAAAAADSAPVPAAAAAVPIAAPIAASPAAGIDLARCDCGGRHAVFVQTDNPSGNRVVAYHRASDGTLGPAGA